MISEQRTLTFLWRCTICRTIYDCETLAFLLYDGTSRACACGGRLVEDVGPAPEHGARPAPRRPYTGLLKVI